MIYAWNIPMVQAQLKIFETYVMFYIWYLPMFLTLLEMFESSLMLSMWYFPMFIALSESVWNSFNTLYVVSLDDPCGI